MSINKNYRYWFNSVHLQEDLKTKSIIGGINTTANQFIGFGLNLISTFILARLLMPSDFGLIGMVTAFTGFAHIIKDLGLSSAVIQKDKINHLQVSKLFWINIAVCIAIGFIYLLLSPLIVNLYHHDTRLYPIIFAYACTIVISGLSLQHNALLCRKMLFGQLAKANILASLISVTLGISSALLGLGYWSLVILSISSDFFNTCFVWHFCNWRPSYTIRKQEINEFLKFGAGLSGSNMINYFSKNADNILLGSKVGATSVGLYSKAYQLLMLPINQLRTPLTLVATPALSSLKKDPKTFVKYYKKYIFILAFFSMPLVACLAIFSKELILIILGHQWLESSHIFRILAIAGFILPVANSRGLVLVSTGQTKRLFYMVCVLSSVTILGFFVGINWGITGIAISLPITTYLLLIPTLLYSFKKTPIRILDFFNEIFLPVVHTLIMICFILLLKTILSSIFSPLLIFFIVSPLGVIFYYVCWKLYPLGRCKLAGIGDLRYVILQRFKQRNSNTNKKNLGFSQ